MNIVDARTKLAAALAPVAAEDPDVLVSLVDAIEPPALMLGWGDPWLEPATACLYDGHLVITAVASRMAPGDGVARLEQLIAYVHDRLRADVESWTLEAVSGPRVFDIARTKYLAVRITVRTSINS